MIEAFSFDKGMNRKKSPLFLSEGEVYTCTGFSFDHDGVLEARNAKTQSYAIDTDSGSTINGIHRYIDSVLASSKALCYGTDAVFTSDGITQPTFNYIYQRDKDGTAFTNIGLLAGNTRPRMADYEKFIFVVDGESKRAYIDANEYEFGIANPAYAPAVVAGAAGNPNAEYTCYVTFYVIFPNDKVYETGPSAATTVTLASEKAEWSKIAICPYEGTGLRIHRKLYRTVSGSPYLVATITDNTTTTYSDDVTDAALLAASAMGTTSYSTPPDFATDIVVHIQRIFMIKDNRLYWSEAYTPFGFKTTSNVVVTKEDEDLVTVIDWGDQLYLGTKERWYRLQGSDPDTWAIKRTFTDNGVINRHTVKKTKFGIMGLDYDGVSLFDGSITTNLTEKVLGKAFFTDLDDLDVCYAEFDGERYYLYYASSGSTLDSCVKLDFSYGRSNVQVYEGGFVDAHEYYREAGIRYQAYAGYEYTEGGTETIVTSVLSGDRGFGNIAQLKNLEYLYYDCNTNSKDLTVTIYVDGSSAFTLTLNNSSRTRKRSQKLPQLEGYRFALGLDCADSQGLKIYSPWLLEGTPVGR